MFIPLEHKIKKGDTLSEIAQMYDSNVEYLAKLNNIKDINKIKAGDTLKLFDFKEGSPTPMTGIPFGEPTQELLEFFAGLNPFKDKESTTQDKKEESKQTKEEESSDSFLPINIRQFFSPKEDRTEQDLSKVELDALKEVIARSQTAERIAEKEKKGISPFAIEYKDYETTAKNSQYADVGGGGMGLSSFYNKLQNPSYNLKTFLGQASAVPQEGGGYRIQDVYDFEPKTTSTGIAKLAQYLSSIPSAGINPYNQLRNYMGYFGPQEGTGEGGRTDIKIMKQGGDTMDIQQQTKNVAAQGRYGDSMLLHVNPAEVKGLAQAMPITVNPQTGQPEAFLPFLAPIFGSMLGGSLLAGSTLGGLASAGLSKAAAAGIGAGLAQTAVTGDIKEGVKAGLFSGMLGRIFGGGAEASKFAEGAQQATTKATDTITSGLLENPNLIAEGTGSKFVGPLAPGATAPAAQLNFAGQNALAAELPNFQPSITKGGADAVAAYSGNIPGTGAATFGDDFTTIFGEGDNFNLGQGLSNIGSAAMNDPLALATLGTTGAMYGMDMMQADYEEQMRRIEEERLERKRQNELMNPEPILYSAEGGPTGYFMGGDVRNMVDRAAKNLDNITGGELPQIYAPARQPYQVNPDFMPGFAPETMYFEPSTLSAPASGLQAGAPPVTVDTYEGSQGGYGGRQAYIAPQVSIDPYAAYTGEAPEGLKFGKPPRPVFEGPELPDQGLVNPGLPDFGTGPVGLGGRIGIPNIGNLDIQSIIDSLDQYNIPEREIGMSEYMPITGQDLGITPPRTLGEPLPKGVDNNIDISQFLGSREDNLAALQTMFGPQVEYATGLEPSIDSGLGEMMTAEALMARGITPQPRGSGILGKGPIIYPDLLNTPVNFPEPLTEEDVQIFEPPIRDRKAGGDTLKSIPEDNKGLSNLPEKVRNKMGYMQAGGNTDIMNDPLTQEVTLFLLGESNDERPLNEFLTKYGNEAFMQLREAVLQSIVPNAQTEGLIRGDGEGGMDDDLRGMIGDKERIAVSQDEFIIPADVVSMLGDGSSDAGSKELYDMMDRVRQTKTGTTKQAPKLANAGGLLPA
jgi:LysM repeat protein